MKTRAYFLVLIMACIALLAGCGGIKTIRVDYVQGYQAQKLFPDKQPVISVNSFYDDRSNSDRVGEGYNAYGNKLETWVAENQPAEIIENAIITQLKNSGFQVIKTSGWNFDPGGIPDHIKTKLLLGGKLKVLWVESKPNFWTITINSKVTFDLMIADVEDKKILWSGQFTGSGQNDFGYRTSDDMAKSLSLALTQAVNKVFQDENSRRILMKFAETDAK